MSKDFSKIATVMNRVYGMDLSVFDPAFLEKSIDRRYIASGIGDPEQYHNCLVNNCVEADAFYHSLHINYSCFFRDSMTFAVLEHRIFPDILSKRPEGSEIRIWSAGCANGQEAYSVGILLSERIEAIGKDYRFRIFATDISSEAIEAGVAGEYDENAVRDVKLKYLNKYFIRQGGNYQIIPRLKQHVIFSRYDLLDQSTANPPESIYGNFDIVMCSNLLFYYIPDLRKTIIRKLLGAVSDNGYLVTGEIEKSIFNNESEIHRISTPTSVFQKSRGG